MRDAIAWLEFAAAAAAFWAAHAIPPTAAVKPRLVRALGRGGYGALYGLASLLGLAWLIQAAGRAPVVALWDWAAWRAWAPMLAMPAVCLLVAFAVAAPNPLSFGGARNAAFDPDRPGVVAVARHPLLWALTLWSAAHLLANGDLAHALMFGGFTAFSVIGMGGIDRRRRARLGEAEWRRLSARTSAYPFAAWVEGRWRPTRPLWAATAARGFMAAAFWTALLLGHAALFGVSPVP